LRLKGGRIFNKLRLGCGEAAAGAALRETHRDDERLLELLALPRELVSPLDAQGDDRGA
jgi:hypothetical protein